MTALVGLVSVVSTSYACNSTCAAPRAPIESMTTRRNTESTVVIVTVSPVLFGVNDVGNTSNRMTALDSTVSGRLARRIDDDSPSVGNPLIVVSSSTAKIVVSLKAFGCVGHRSGQAPPPSILSVQAATNTARTIAVRTATDDFRVCKRRGEAG